MTGRIIDQVRASKLPSNMMQFAARGALQVPPAENIEILVHLALHNKVFGELARMTLAGWDEKTSRTAASDPRNLRRGARLFHLARQSAPQATSRSARESFGA